VECGIHEVIPCAGQDFYWKGIATIQAERLNRSFPGNNP